MHDTPVPSSNILSSFQMASVAMRYSEFVPRAYNLARTLGFKKGKIMPSRAFCSDESQGYPIILIAKHFGTFPFNHGLVGGVVASDRHGPYSQHGEDLVIIQASHVGYNPESKKFGVYRRLQTKQQIESDNCGKICHSIQWYMNEYEFACCNIYLKKDNDAYKISVDNQLLQIERKQGLILKLNRLLKLNNEGKPDPEQSLSTSKIFSVSEELQRYLEPLNWSNGHSEQIGAHLQSDMFFFRRKIEFISEGSNRMESNLIAMMPYIVTSKWPALTAAQINTQVEFDSAFRAIVQQTAYKGRNILFLSGLNIDISPKEGQLFPLTKFIPWAAFYQDKDNNHQTWEQLEVFKRLAQQPVKNPDQVDLETAIASMRSEKEIRLPF
ncbi:hypothetical protein MNBD_GAMMA12-2168 [hydrothermal vent metagenome]|uniref:Limiting CO2-inducible protein B/C beta carbonyic anhydrase domain-containing protein n=1 Tax=hydrothermal vent metagenome TaxID=652676 RepID=A0A3B0Z5C0_9ZZZZ